jgi:EAL domain-containing protein (putative c-di-GMP-specific phosphodiesterase class I)
VPGVGDFEVSVSSAGHGEFTVLLTDIQDAECTTWIVQRLLCAIDETIEIEGREILADARIGVSLYPGDAEDPDILLANSATALREAKAEPGRQVCLFYSRAMNQRSKEQLYMETQLHKAIERDELYLEYQPVVDIRTAQITGFEALLRWHHPDLGMVRPDRFIPVAEHAGLIDRIGEWVLQTASLQLKSWHDMGIGKLSMAINFSAVQFRRSDLVERVVANLVEVGVDPSSLVVEITESALIQNLDTAVQMVQGLSSAGLSVALDDFGTGYSSLSYLRRFPIDIVKIDRSFLRDFPMHAGDTEIVSAIIAIAHSLGLRVIAEGVESDRQLQVLHNMQCDEIQGYLLSKPISREQATALLLNPIQIRRIVRAASQHVIRDLPSRASSIAGVVNVSPRRGFMQ